MPLYLLEKNPLKGPVSLLIWIFFISSRKITFRRVLISTKKFMGRAFIFSRKRPFIKAFIVSRKLTHGRTSISSTGKFLERAFIFSTRIRLEKSSFVWKCFWNYLISSRKIPFRALICSRKTLFGITFIYSRKRPTGKALICFKKNLWISLHLSKNLWKDIHHSSLEKILDLLNTTFNKIPFGRARKIPSVKAQIFF